jgi:hypothetical protein
MVHDLNLQTPTSSSSQQRLVVKEIKRSGGVEKVQSGQSTSHESKPFSEEGDVRTGWCVK